MAQFRPTAIEMNLAAAIEAGNATESAVQTVFVKGQTTGNGLQRGAVTGCNVTSDTADTIVVRAYNDSSKTRKLLEVSAVIAAVDDWEGAQFAQPIPFYEGLFWTAEATAASRNVQVFFDLIAIAGRGSS